MVFKLLNLEKVCSEKSHFASLHAKLKKVRLIYFKLLQKEKVAQIFNEITMEISKHNFGQQN